MILTFDSVREAFLSTFPEVRDWAKTTFGREYNLEEDAPEHYPLFEDVVKPFVFDLLQPGENETLLERLFSFFEDMAESPERDVTDLFGIAVLEPLVCKNESVRQAWKYMGPKTRELTITEARRQGRVSNLPVQAIEPS